MICENHMQFKFQRPLIKCWERSHACSFSSVAPATTAEGSWPETVGHRSVRYVLSGP